MKYPVIAITLAALLLTACGPDPDMPLRRKQDMQEADATFPTIKDDNRVDVARIGVFRDSLAYGNKRGVYVITDKKTGVEFIGISGVGIAEVARHNDHAGKTSVSDER